MRDERVTSRHGNAASAATAQEAVPLGLERPGSPRAQLVGQVGGTAAAPAARTAHASAGSEAAGRLADRRVSLARRQPDPLSPAVVGLEQLLRVPDVEPRPGEPISVDGLPLVEPG